MNWLIYPPWSHCHCTNYFMDFVQFGLFDSLGCLTVPLTLATY
jgi:hypothetical protein